jgi:SAM-dependent methyltransferase
MLQETIDLQPKGETDEPIKRLRFVDFVAELYDYVIPYRDRPDVSFYIEAALQARGPVLEIGCGTGRVLIPTAKAGIEITGLDLSEHMLEVCQRRLLTEPDEVQTRIQLFRMDMRSFELARQFHLVTVLFDRSNTC